MTRMSIEIISAGNCLTTYKNNRHYKRALRLTVHGRFAGTGRTHGLRHEFPKCQVSMIVHDVLDDGGCIIETTASGVRRVFCGKNYLAPYYALCPSVIRTTENMLNCAAHTYRLKDLIASDKHRRALLATIGLKRSDKPFPHANKGAVSSHTQHWNDKQWVQFEGICGPLMDVLYPGWLRRPDMQICA